MESSSPFPLERLDDDLLHIVFERLNEISSNSMICCSAVCHRFYRLGVPIVNRHALLYNLHNNGNTLRWIRQDSAMPKMTQSVHFQDGTESGSGDAMPLVKFVHAAAGSKRLKVIKMYGSYQVSQVLLDAINEMFPDVRFELNASFPREEDGWYRGWGVGGPLPGGMNGFSSPQLHTLEIDSMWMVDNQGKEVVTRSLSKIIRNCPNLRKFGTWRPSKSIVWNGAAQELHLDLTNATKLPALAVFSFIPLTLDTLKTWGAVTGWEGLHTLRVCPEYIHFFATRHMPSLRHLTVAVEESSPFSSDHLDQAQAFTAPVQSIFITRLSDSHIPHIFLSHFAATLTEVSLHPTGMGPPDPFSNADVHHLKSTCPNLERLCIRLVLNGSWPYDLLEGFNEFERLTELFLDCGYRGEINPRPDAPTCARIYKLIQDTKKGSVLKVIGLHYGNDWVSRASDWEEMRQRTWFLCTRSSSGSLRVQKQGRRYDNDMHIDKYRMTWKVRQATLKERPFSRAYDPSIISQNGLHFIAKKLGPNGGPKWAEDSLLPQGLITREILDAKLWYGNMALIRKCNDADDKERQRMRDLISEELRYWKKRDEIAEKHGEHFFLWDIMYPTAEGVEPQRLNDVWK